MLDFQLHRTPNDLLAVLSVKSTPASDSKILRYWHIFTKGPNTIQTNSGGYGINHSNIHDQELQIDISDSLKDIVLDDMRAPNSLLRAKSRSDAITEVIYYTGFDVRRKLHVPFQVQIMWPANSADEYLSVFDKVTHQLHPYDSINAEITTDGVYFTTTNRSGKQIQYEIISDGYIADHILLIQYDNIEHSFILYTAMDGRHLEWFNSYADKAVSAELLQKREDIYGGTSYRFTPEYLAKSSPMSSLTRELIPFTVINPFDAVNIEICPVKSDFALGN